MEIAVKAASIIVGERSLRLSKEGILRKNIPEKKKEELIERLELRHQAKVYKLLFRLTKGLLAITKFLGVMCAIIGIVILGSESASFIYNFIGAFMFAGLTFFSYFMYELIEDDKLKYREELERVGKRLRLLK